MEELPFDLPRLTAIWKEVEANDDARLQDSKADVSRRYNEVVDNPLSVAGHLTFNAKGTLLEPSPKEIMLFILDVANFALGVYGFYEQLASYRPLTPRDKELGKSLKTLLKQAEDNLISLKTWNAAVLFEESTKSSDWPVARPTKEAV